MTYLERAKLMHGRGDAVRAAFILAEGLRRDLHNAEALEWLLHLYVEEVPQPGMERDVLAILDRQPNGQELLHIVEAELRELNSEAKLIALKKVRARESLVTGAQAIVSAVDEPVPPPGASLSPSAPGLPQSQTPTPSVPAPATAPPVAAEYWEAFQSPLREAPDAEANARRRLGGATVPTRFKTGTDLAAWEESPPLEEADYAALKRKAWIRVAVVFAVLVLVGVGLFMFIDPPAGPASPAGAAHANPAAVGGTPGFEGSGSGGAR